MTRASLGLVVSLMLGSGALPMSIARAAQIHSHDPDASAASSPPQSASSRASPRAPNVSPRAPSGSPRAPSGPPLVSGAEDVGLGESAPAGADASSSAPSSGGDPLVENGLGSPLCGMAASDLSVVSRRNCATSGFEAAGAPTGNYALDVHIDTGALGFTAATLEQDYLIEPVWMGLVWVAHTLVVAVEWCFTLDLLGGAAMGGIERALRATQVTLTRPWLVLALALASLAAAYNGLVRRRVAETLGQAVLMLAMMAGGLWVIADPSGTVGVLGRWTDAAGAGTLGAVVAGTPTQASRTLADSMGGLFAGVVSAPWCYLEFGDVRWCMEPALLDRRLRAAALRIAAGAQAGGGCAGGAGGLVGAAGGLESVCQVLAGEQPRARAQSATLLRAARTNGELFLALPADAAARNSINDRASLLSALCGGSSDATDCRGPTASAAEFRTQGGTASRVGGLLLIALGALGMLLLLGFIVLHLLGSELLGLLYLLLAPAAVIAPALGDGGRMAFRGWATRLVGAVTSKLLFSFLLGVVLLLTRLLLELNGFGWWTRWLLVSAMWWGSYFQRGRVLGFVSGERPQLGGHVSGGGQRAAARHGLGPGLGQAVHRDSVARRVQRQLESPLATLRAARWVRGKLAKPAPPVERRQVRERFGHERARGAANGQATRMLECEREQAIEDVADAPRAQAELAQQRAQLQRVRAARATAVAAGDTVRAARLEVRAGRIEHEVGRAQTRLDVAYRTVAAGERARRATGRRSTPAEAKARAGWLDAQAKLADSARRGYAAPTGRAGRDDAALAGNARRDYAALASLVGYGRGQYERLAPRQRREARLAIDRELALRRELGVVVGRVGGPGVAVGSAGTPGVRRQAGTLGVRRQAAAHDGTRGGRELDRGGAGRESTVMRDAREVAQRRKRQLGY